MCVDVKYLWRHLPHPVAGLLNEYSTQQAGVVLIRCSKAYRVIFLLFFFVRFCPLLPLLYPRPFEDTPRAWWLQKHAEPTQVSCHLLKSARCITLIDHRIEYVTLVCPSFDAQPSSPRASKSLQKCQSLCVSLHCYRPAVEMLCFSSKVSTDAQFSNKHERCRSAVQYHEGKNMPYLCNMHDAKACRTCSSMMSDCGPNCARGDRPTTTPPLKQTSAADNKADGHTDRVWVPEALVKDYVDPSPSSFMRLSVTQIDNAGR